MAKTIPRKAQVEMEGLLERMREKGISTYFKQYLISNTPYTSKQLIELYKSKTK